MMMHGFGDCQRPMVETAALIETIVHQQMSSLLQQVKFVQPTTVITRHVDYISRLPPSSLILEYSAPHSSGDSRTQNHQNGQEHRARDGANQANDYT